MQMKQIYEAARFLNQVALTALIVVAMFFIVDPELAGNWLVKRDIAYDTVWMIYVADCDCTPSSE